MQIYLSLLRTAPPTARAPGKITPRGTATAVCRATDATESSGTMAIRAAAAAADAAAPPKRVDGGALRADAAIGRRPGARSIALAASGRTLSLEASR
jgi:hypothetical protein